MTQLAELKVLTEDEQNEMYQRAERELAERENEWKAAQDEFLNENPDYRDNPDFVAEVNRIVASDEGKTMSDRQILESAFVRNFLRGGQ